MKTYLRTSQVTGTLARLRPYLRTLGRRDDSIAAYRNAIARFPKLGEPYWSLANLKTFHFTDAEAETMRALLATGNLPVESRIQINFALGKALEDKARIPSVFRVLQGRQCAQTRDARLQRRNESVYVMNCKTLFTRKYFDEFAGSGSQAQDPIFIVGLPARDRP